jgi:deoxyribodipyrimidine photolyase-related protein
MLPIDSIIKKIVNYAYAHHIERLMYLGNFMLICQVDPKEVFRIFMEWSIDSYEWVMIPNVMGMSQYSSPIMMTRPYFSSSNYINKMSTYKVSSKDTWSKTWDALYYNFINSNENIFRKNYAIAQQVKHWDNKTEDEKKEIKKLAKEYIKSVLD